MSRGRREERDFHRAARGTFEPVLITRSLLGAVSGGKDGRERFWTGNVGLGVSFVTLAYAYVSPVSRASVSCVEEHEACTDLGNTRYGL